jgi:site-specific recombinase XerD
MPLRDLHVRPGFIPHLRRLTRSRCGLCGQSANREPCPRLSPPALSEASARLSRRNLYPCSRPRKHDGSTATLLDQVRAAARLRHFSPRTEKAYLGWIRRYVLFHGKRHPREMGAQEVRAFLTHLAVERRVAASTQTQALAALLFLYRRVLRLPLGELGEIERARKPVRLPVVLTRAEVGAVLAALNGSSRLVAGLLYGSGLRLTEALRLRVKDVDFEMHSLVVRRGKGAKDRISILPERLGQPLAAHLERVQELLGHKDVRTTMIYTHVLNRAGRGVKSPLDAI